MKLRHLRIFKCVCEEMNMTRAAQRLFMSQPSVSQVVRELEAHYETQLFERPSRKLYLTDSGAALLRYAEHMLALNTELEETMHSNNRIQKLRIGATVTIGTYCLPHWIAGFCADRQDVEIISCIQNTQDIEKHLLNATIDMGLVEGKIDKPEIVVRAFMQDELVVVCPRAHPLAGSAHLEKESISQVPFFIREKGSGSRRMFLDRVREQNIPIQIIGEFNNNEAIKNAVTNGLGFGVVSRASITEHDKLHTLRIKDIQMVREFSLAYHRDKLLNPALKAFMEHIYKQPK